MKWHTKHVSNEGQPDSEASEERSSASLLDKVDALGTLSCAQGLSGYCNYCSLNSSGTLVDQTTAQTDAQTHDANGLYASCCRDLVELEQRLYRHPSIASAMAFCYADEQTEAKFGAAIQLQDWVQRAVASEIKQWLSRHLKPELIPERIIWIDQRHTPTNE